MSRPTTSVLGVSAYYHDAAAAIVVGGDVVAAAAEERFSRIKHDRSFPRLAIEFCLQQADLRPQDVDRVVFYEQPHVKFTRVLASTIAGFPRSAGHFVRGMKNWLGSRLWVRNEISAALDIDPARVGLVPHHGAHAAQAFLCSPFDEAAILTVDAVGEWECSTIAHGRKDPPGIETLETAEYPASLGLAYAAFTAFLGFRANDAEASTMALSAFGEPRHVDEVRRIVRPRGDGWYSIDERYLDFLGSGHQVFRTPFRELFGDPRPFDRPLPFDCLPSSSPPEVPERDRRYADLAASVQAVFEDAMLDLARRARRLTSASRLCLAGGTALNALANSRLIAESGFEDVYIPPDPTDAGASLGSALWSYLQDTGQPPRSCTTAYFGKTAHEHDLDGLLDHLDPSEWSRFLAEGIAPVTRLQVQRFERGSELAEATAQALARGQIVAWMQDRFELGPRALGNRSILADPADLDTARRLSAHVKRRASFRPYALSIRAEDVPQVFDIDGEPPRCSRWMQMVLPVRPEVRPQVRAAIHLDGTTRLQVVSAEDNERFHALLSAFARTGRIGALLNTSLNDPGFPMLSSPTEGLLFFARSDADTLVVGQTMITKERAS